VQVDQGKCIGCEFCVQACPFGVIVLAKCSGRDAPDSARVVIKCDLCANRLAEGLEPACVAACPVGALMFEEASQSARRSRALTAARAAAAESADGRGGATARSGRM
jgi:Fe-S-cluster-containing dehydrogenase component